MLMRLEMKLLPTIILLTSLFSVAAFAEDSTEPERWYQVEVMIFKNPIKETDNPESWPAFPDITHPPSFIRLEGISEILTDNSETSEQLEDETNTPATAVELPAPESTQGLKAFKALSEFERLMIKQRETLESNSRYKILFHEAWNQPVPGRDNVIPIRIDGGERFGRQSELQGYISLYVERYLHLSTDLNLITYEQSSDPFSVIGDVTSGLNSEQTLDTFGGISLLNADSLSNNQISRKSNQFFISVQSAQLKESRRMRSREIHYLDNPEFGMLVLITPIEIK